MAVTVLNNPAGLRLKFDLGSESFLFFWLERLKK